jgi:hypothetical protein
MFAVNIGTGLDFTGGNLTCTVTPGLTSVDNSTTSNMTGVVYGNGSALSSDTGFTTDGVGNVTVGTLTGGGATVSSCDFGPNVELQVRDSSVKLSNLPTTDPGNTGQLWCDPADGLLRVSP